MCRYITVGVYRKDRFLAWAKDRPVRQTPAGYTGIVYETKIYSVYINKHDHLSIDINDISWKKDPNVCPIAKKPLPFLDDLVVCHENEDTPKLEENPVCLGGLIGDVIPDCETELNDCIDEASREITPSLRDIFETFEQENNIHETCSDKFNNTEDIITSDSTEEEARFPTPESNFLHPVCSGVLADVAEGSSFEVKSMAEVMRTEFRRLILESDVSVRLRNCISNSEALPFATVGEYIRSGSLGMVKMLSVPHLGKKTALELDSLVKEYVASGTVLPEGESGNEEHTLTEQDKGRSAVLCLLEKIPLQAALIHIGLDGRVKKGVEILNDINSVRELIERYDELRMRLLQSLNFGRKSLAKLEATVEDITRLRVRQIFGDGACAALITFDELIGNDVPEPCLHQFAKGGGFDGGENVDLDALFSETTDSQDDPKGEYTLRIVNSLPTKERDVIFRRYGLDEFIPQSLEDIAREFHVTRERVRQVETSGLKILRIPKNSTVFRKILDSETDEMWDLISDGTGFLVADEVSSQANRFDNLIRLALDVVHDGVHGWIKTTARPILGGWLQKEISTEELKNDVRVLAGLVEGRLFPMPIEYAKKQTGMDLARLNRAIRLVPELRIFEGHLIKGHLGAQAKRTVRLYSTMSACQGYGLVDFRIILDEYIRKFPEDACLLRIAELTLERAPHLFKKVFDNFWLTLPLADDINSPAPTPWKADAILYSSMYDENDPAPELFSVKNWLADLFATRGPMRFFDIKVAGQESLPEHISVNSLGPVLLSAGEFVRLAPGVYGLPRHLLAIKHSGCRYPASMMTEEQCRWYAMARKAGEPVSLFPAWDYRFEKALCYLAWGHCSGDLFGSLLSVSDPSMWECLPDESEKWRLLKKQHGRRYTLNVPCRHPLDPKRITPDQLLSALLLMRATGGLSWVSFNRATLNRIDSHKCAGGLALLIAMGAIQPSSHWQDRHLPGPNAERILRILSDELFSVGYLFWNSDRIRFLLKDARANFPFSGSGWVDGNAAREFLDQLLEAAEETTVGQEGDGSEWDELLADPGGLLEWEQIDQTNGNSQAENHDQSDGNIQSDPLADLFSDDEWNQQWVD